MAFRALIRPYSPSSSTEETIASATFRERASSHDQDQDAVASTVPSRLARSPPASGRVFTSLPVGGL